MDQIVKNTSYWISFYETKGHLLSQKAIKISIIVREAKGRH